MSDKKTFLIGCLTISAAILSAGHFELSRTARANETVIEDDYQLVTALTRKGDDGLYILDKRKNLLALFTWDASKKSIAPSDVKSVDAMLGGS